MHRECQGSSDRAGAAADWLVIQIPVGLGLVSSGCPAGPEHRRLFIPVAPTRCQRDALALAANSRPVSGNLAAPGPVPGPSPNPIAAEPNDGRVLPGGGVADHAVTPQAPLTGSGCRGYSCGGFGGGHPYFLPHAPDLRSVDICQGRAVIAGRETDRDDRRDLPARLAAGVDEHGLDVYDQLLPRYPTAPPWCPARPPRYSSGHPRAPGVS